MLNAAQAHEIAKNAKYNVVCQNFFDPISGEIEKEARVGKFEAKIAWGPQWLQDTFFAPQDIAAMTDIIVKKLQDEGYDVQIQLEDTEYGRFDVMTVKF